MDEREAIARCRHGDAHGLEYLVQTYELPAVRAAYLIVGERALAEDIVQEAFLHAYEQIQQFDPARSFSPWFLQSVVHRAIRAATRAARTRPWDAAADAALGRIPEVQTDPAERVVTAETSAAIWAVVARLPPDQRAAIVLRYYLDLNEAEMAAYLACPPGTVKSRLHSARARLRRLLPGWIRDADQSAGTIYVGLARDPGETNEETP